MMASGPCGHLYIGHTENLERRTAEHKSHSFSTAYTRRYNIHMLVYYEKVGTRTEAKRREAILKKLARHKKFALVENQNPHWSDLSASWSR